MTKMIANMRVSSTVSGSQLGSFVTQTEVLLTEVKKDVKSRVHDFLQSQKIDVNEENTKIFSIQLQFDWPFPKYKDMRGQIAVMKQKYIEPRDVAIGYRKILVTNSDNTKEYIDRPVTIKYVSPIDILILILSIDEVFDYVTTHQYPTEDNGVLRSYEDGKIFKLNQFFKKYLNAMDAYLKKKKKKSLGDFTYLLQNYLNTYGTLLVTCMSLLLEKTGKLENMELTHV